MTDNLVQEIDKRYDRAMRAQRAVLREAEEARLFFRGDQWIVFRGGQWQPAPAPRWRVRLVANKLIPMASLLVGSLTRKDPMISVYPASGDEADFRAASCAERLLRYYWDELSMSTSFQRWMYYTIVLGNYFVEVSWDPLKELPLLRGVSPYSIAIEPGAVEFSDAQWYIITEFARIGQLELTYNQKIEKVDPPSGMMMYYPKALDATQDLEERTLVQRMYERPTQAFPQGRIVVRAGNSIVMQEPLPAGANGPEVRIVHFGAIQLPDELWCTSPVSQCIPQQVELNRSRSQLLENRNLCGRPQIIAPLGAIEEGKWTNEPGAIIEWDTIQARGIEPHYVVPPSVPSWVISIMQACEQDMYDIFGRHEVAQGQLVATSGRLAGLLKGSDDDRWYMMAYRAEEALKKIGQYMLSTTKQNMSSAKVISIIGKDGEMDYHSLSNNDISENVTVRYDLVSRLTWAKDSMRQMAMTLAQTGAIDRETMQDILEMPVPQKLYSSYYDSRVNARTENMMLYQGEDIDPLPTDNHEVHIEEHTKFLNTPELRTGIMKSIAGKKKLAEITGEQIDIYSDISNVLRHLEEHRKMMPKKEPPPPAPKVNIGLDRLIRDLITTRPDLAQALLPYVVQLVQDSIGSPQTQPQSEAEPEQEPEARVRAAGEVPPSKEPSTEPVEARVGEFIAEDMASRYEG